MRETSRWYSERLHQETQLIRWGHYGVPLLLFPTAGGDAAEVERCGLIHALEPFIREGRLKVYSIDSIAGRTWLTNGNVAHCVWTQKQFDAYVRDEVLPAIRFDCRSNSVQVITAGASIGAFHALQAVCRYPDVFSRAICMSGTYDLEKWLKGQWFDDFYYLSPLHFVPGLQPGDQLYQLQRRYIILATGRGKYEDPSESWKVANALGRVGIPNRVDEWDWSWDHDWPTWHRMLPQYVQEVLASM